jgi:hypothetical protein
MTSTGIFASLEWWHVAFSLAALALTIFGRGFTQWSKALESATRTWGERLEHAVDSIVMRIDRQEQRQEAQERRLEQHIQQLNQANLRTIDRIARIEGQLATKIAAAHWSDEHEGKG